MTGFNIKPFGDRLICIGGIGKMFYQYGFPISITVQKLKEKGIESCILHVADECLKNGWVAETTYKKLREDFADSGENNPESMETLEKFCFATYEDQREMIFQFLFGAPSKAMIDGSADRKLADQFLIRHLQI